MKSLERVANSSFSFNEQARQARAMFAVQSAEAEIVIVVPPEFESLIKHFVKAGVKRAKRSSAKASAFYYTITDKDYKEITNGNDDVSRDLSRSVQECIGKIRAYAAINEGIRSRERDNRERKRTQESISGEIKGATRGVEEEKRRERLSLKEVKDFLREYKNFITRSRLQDGITLSNEQSKALRNYIFGAISSQDFLASDLKTNSITSLTTFRGKV